MTTPTIDPAHAVDAAAIAAFAQAVRERLDDLPTDDVDDLTDGLVADLSEQAADDSAFTLPDPIAYADELRAAAGLAERTTAPQEPPLGERLRGWLASTVTRVRANPATAWVLDLLVSLRPFWWVIRGLVISGLLLGGTLPRSFFAWIFVIAVVVLSVQWGRGQWLPWPWLRVTKTIVSIIAALAIMPMTSSAVQSLRNEGAATVYMDDLSVPGLSMDGERVRNIFAYDADGNLLTNVQLFTQNGAPLNTVSRDQFEQRLNVDDYFYGGGGPVPVPYLTNDQRRVWNVYPLRELTDAQAADGWIDGVDPNDAGIPLPPFTNASQLEGVTPTPTPTPIPSDGTDETPAPAPDEPAPGDEAPAEPAPSSEPTPEPSV